MRKKILLISFALSLPFWWGMNVLAVNLQDFYFQQELTKNQYILTAQLNQKILEKGLERLALEKEQRERLAGLEIEAKSVISVELDAEGNRRILFEKNSNELLPIASLTKLMTALVVFDLDESYSPSQLITISKEAVNQEGQSKYGDLMIGEKLSIEALLYIMLIESSNDAAFALSELVGEKGFVDLMNIYAKNLGLSDTRFINPTGLEPDKTEEPKNLSTAQDLALISEYILRKYPQIFGITVSQSHQVLNPDGSLHHFIPQNTNVLLGEIPEIIGGKTGWSPEAGGCLLLILKNPKRNGYFINLILGSNDRFNEMLKICQRLL